MLALCQHLEINGAFAPRSPLCAFGSAVCPLSLWEIGLYLAIPVKLQAGGCHNAAAVEEEPNRASGYIFAGRLILIMASVPPALDHGPPQRATGTRHRTGSHKSRVLKDANHILGR